MIAVAGVDLQLDGLTHLGFSSSSTNLGSSIDLLIHCTSIVSDLNASGQAILDTDTGQIFEFGTPPFPFSGKRGVSARKTVGKNVRTLFV